MKAMGKEAEPIENSYWVIPGRFKAGEHPGIHSGRDVKKKLRWLMDDRIDFIIDLTGPLPSGLDYSTSITDVATLNKCQVDYKQISIQDFNTPHKQKMVDILDIIDKALLNGKNIYLHCCYGQGRTGTVVGCYLARHGTQGEEALQKIQELRAGIPNADSRSPETTDQIRMVKEWTKGL